MPKAVVVSAFGGTEVLSFKDMPSKKPGAGELRVRAIAIGVNFIDVYHRTGLYPQPLPFVLGKEMAGVVEEVGEGVTGFRKGDRVASATVSGSYAEEITAPESIFVKVPDGISDEMAAAMMLKGMTARYLLRKTFAVGPGHTILFHAASGGVGSIATQWAHHLGATVIGTVGSEEKAKLARQNGVDHTILYRSEDVAKRVAEITKGAKCDVVYDSVGNTTYIGSLDSLKPLGMFVLFGQSSGPVKGFDPSMLAARGSLFMTRPTLFNYTATRETLDETANDLFGVVASGKVKIEIGARFALKDVADAHRALEGRETTGSTILIP
ncbi:quinone oxidoreductase [Terrihabitans soli]|uniref:Quinone oxidoreductase n=1 Tax=Terrihabitans soli TaxID=708113 RepID=A0A6S6QPN3_9HYPH|nr:quinone oxidoreductase [Terrihabitans soli]BCJ90959.1 quinone oxidoreductase [Terrihabitans soli]